MSLIWMIFLPSALGLLMAIGAAAQHKTQDPVALATTHLKAEPLSFG